MTRIRASGARPERKGEARRGLSLAGQRWRGAVGHDKAWMGEAMKRDARLARPGLVGIGSAIQSRERLARQERQGEAGMAMHSKERLGTDWQGRRGKAGGGKVWRGGAGLGNAGYVRQGPEWQGSARQGDAGKAGQYGLGTDGHGVAGTARSGWAVKCEVVQAPERRGTANGKAERRLTAGQTATFDN